MPNQPATPARSVRIPDELWELVLREVDDMGGTATDVVIRALREHFR